AHDSGERLERSDWRGGPPRRGCINNSAQRSPCAPLAGSGAEAAGVRRAASATTRAVMMKVTGPMMNRANNIQVCSVLGFMALSLLGASAGRATSVVDAERIWAHDNLIAWEVMPFDAKHRSPDERAEMLKRLGFKYY